MKRNIHAVVFLFTLLVPGIASADLISPLLIPNELFPLLGNAVIGAVEGVLLIVFFKLRDRINTIVNLVAANYFSADVGFYLLFFVLDGSYEPLSWAGISGAYVLTLVLEYPFVALCFRGDPAWLRKSLLGTFVVQTVSYVLLIGGFALVEMWPI